MIPGLNRFIAMTMWVFLLVGIQAQAVDYGDSVRYVKDLEYRGEIFHRTGSKEYTITVAMEDEIKPVMQNVEEFSAQAQSEISQMYGSLYASLYDAVDSAHGEVTGFNFRTGDFPNKFSLELIGEQNGKVVARFGPLKLDLQASAKESWSSAIWSADVNLTTGTFYIQGEYDVFTGTMSNVTLENFNYDFDVDLDGILISLLEPFMGDFEEKAENQFSNAIVSALNELGSREFKLFDVNMALPSNEYVTAAGYDLAEEVRSAISNIVSGERIKFSGEREFVRYSSTHYSDPWAGSDQYYKTHELFIEFGQSSNTTVRLWDIGHFGWTYATECNWGECFAPDSTVDLPDTNDGWIDVDIVDLSPEPEPDPEPVPSGASCTWSSSPSYGNGMGGVTYYEYPPIGPCTHSLKKVTNSYGQVTIQYQ